LLPWQQGSVGVKFSWQHLVAQLKTPPQMKKNLADISYTNRVIANFVPNFVAMATGVGQGKMRWWHLMADPRKPSYKRKKISQKPLTQADL